MKSFPNYLILFVLLFFVPINVFAQFNDANTQITSSSGNFTPCPNEEVTYTIQSTVPGFGTNSYQFIWTLPYSGGCFVQLTNCVPQVGNANMRSTQQSVTVRWNNTAAIQRVDCEIFPTSQNMSVYKKFSDAIAIRASGGSAGAILTNGSNTNVVACGSAPVTFSINPISDATSYQWTLPSGWVGNSTTSSITVTPNQTGNGSVDVRVNRAGCGGFFSQSNLFINRPLPRVNQPTGSYNLCANESRTISVTGTNTTNYSWSATNGFSVSNVTVSGSGSSATITAPPAGSNITGVISVTASSVACGNGNTISFNATSTGAIPSSSLLSASGAGMTVAWH